MELYEEVDNKKKSKLPMIIGISLTVLIILIIVIIGTIIYLKQSVMQITVNGQNKNEIEKLLYIPEDDNTKLYIPIRAIAKYLNYNDFRGDYKIKSEDSTKCYVKNENEIAMFTKDSDTLVKTRGDSDYEYVKLEEKVLEKDGELYTTPSGIEKAFNILFEYNANKKNINIYTMDYLNKMYASKLKIDGETVKLSEEYSDQKAIFEGLIIVIKNNIYDKNVDLKFIYKRKLKKQDFKDVNSHRITTTMLDYRFIEESIRWDKKLIHCVNSGSKVNSVKILDKIFDLYFIDEESYNIRKYQNKLIYYNTLLLDLLIEKDFGNLYATGLFQRYMDKIEGARFIRDIKNIFYDMIMDYCFAISEFSVKHYSVLVGKAINYINSNLENNLSVSEIANQLYVSPTQYRKIFN